MATERQIRTNRANPAKDENFKTNPIQSASTHKEPICNEGTTFNKRHSAP